MASILQAVFSQGLSDDYKKRLRTATCHASLYLGIIVYTAVGAKVRNGLSRNKIIYRQGKKSLLLVTVLSH